MFFQRSGTISNNKKATHKNLNDNEFEISSKHKVETHNKQSIQKTKDDNHESLNKQKIINRKHTTSTIYKSLTSLAAASVTAPS